MTERFTADPRAARTERITAAVGAAVAIPALLWLLGVVRNPAALAAAAAAAGIAVYALTAWRAAREGLVWLEIGDDGLAVERRDGRHAVRWTEVTRASRASYGRTWVLTTTGHPRHLILRLDPLTPADATRASTLIRQHVR